MAEHTPPPGATASRRPFADRLTEAIIALAVARGRHALARENLPDAADNQADRVEQDKATLDQLIEAAYDEQTRAEDEDRDVDADELSRLIDYAVKLRDDNTVLPGEAVVDLLTRRTPGNGAVPATLRRSQTITALAQLKLEHPGAYEAGILEVRKQHGHQETQALQGTVSKRAAAMKRTSGGPRPTDKLTLDDKGNARRLVAAHGNRLRYVPSLGWHEYDATRWAPDDTGEVHRAAKKISDDLLDEAKETDDADARKAMVKFALRSGDKPRLEATVKLAETERPVAVRAAELDRDPLLLNTPAGTVDLRTSQLRAHDPADLLTKLTGPYDPSAACPSFEQFLIEIFDGDEDLVGYVQRAAGYSLTGDTGEQCLFLLHGEGENGKSTLLEILAAALGDYADAIAVTSLTTDHKRGVRSDLATLRGARLVRGVEAEQTAQWAESTVKAITGGDTIKVSRLYENEAQLRFTCKLWLGVNHLPEVRHGGHAIWRRMRVVPFRHNFGDDPRRERKTILDARLRSELPGILAWAIAGAADWHRVGLREPAAVLDATGAYRTSGQQIANPREWLAERCILGNPDDWTSAKGLHDDFAAWAGERGEHAGEQRALSDWLSDQSYPHRRKTIGGQKPWGFDGIALRPEALS